MFGKEKNKKDYSIEGGYPAALIIDAYENGEKESLTKACGIIVKGTLIKGR